ncbi:Homeobox protein unc-62 [Aphelenchoides besseyi]|nr:Homeobox protein unc-62 [Aphelenchoides besseyi]
MDPNAWPPQYPPIDYWQSAAAAFAGMPQFTAQPVAPPTFDPNGHLPMKMENIKNEYAADTYGGQTSEISTLYAAGAASIGGGESAVSSAADFFGSSLPTSEAYGELSAGPSSLLAGLGNEEQLKSQQEAIRSHPLYPFLIVIFERCELATSTPRDAPKEPGAMPEKASDQFKDDLLAFKKTIADQNSRYYAADPELDKFMLSAIQVLRLHLLELEKVHDLCDQFCNRYVNTLKDQMPMDLMDAERAASGGGGPSSSGLSNNSPYAPPQQQLQPPAYEPQSVPLPESHHHHQSADISQPAGTSYDLSGQSATPPNFHMATHQPPSSGGSLESPRNDSSTSRNGSTPQNPTPGAQQQSANHQDTISDAGDADSIGGSLNDEGRESVGSEHGESGSTIGGMNSSGEQRQNGRRRVPKVFSKEAITKFRAWLFSNLTHPYPSEEQKKQLAQETGLTILQVNNWFINARRHSSNRAGHQAPCNVFKNRRRKNSDRSPSPGVMTSESGPTGNAAALTYSPDNMMAMAASAATISQQYPTAAAAAFIPPSYAFPTPGFATSQMFGVIPGYSAPGMTSDWMGSFGSMDN